MWNLTFIIHRGFHIRATPSDHPFFPSKNHSFLGYPHWWKTPGPPGRSRSPSQNHRDPGRYGMSSHAPDRRVHPTWRIIPRIIPLVSVSGVSNHPQKKRITLLSWDLRSPGLRAVGWGYILYWHIPIRISLVPGHIDLQKLGHIFVVFIGWKMHSSTVGSHLGIPWRSDSKIPSWLPRKRASNMFLEKTLLGWRSG